MAKTKPQKSKLKKKPHNDVKKKGKKADLTEFRSQVDALGLKVIEVTSDGNCFFRALADQLEGDEELHEKYRHMVVQYILINREDFEPFIEDDVPFDEYCQNMEKDGTWAGNMELQAASLVTHTNICIHRMMSPRWYIRNFDDRATRMVHLSYHNEEHYNSLRLKEDPCTGPAKPIVVKADADLSTTSLKAKGAAKSKEGPCSDTSGPVKLVMAGSGCKNIHKAGQSLQLVDGEYDELCNLVMNGHDEHKQCERLTDALEEDTCGHCRDIKSVHDHNSSLPIDKVMNSKQVPRNKVCPCGSKKKYKSCCGTGKGSTYIESIREQNITSGKGKKERKGGPRQTALSGGSGGELPDMGALCI